MPPYDILIIGAGPAGLGAARVAASNGLRTAVIERANSAGILDHPCSAVIAPLPGFVSGHASEVGITFPEVHLDIPAEMITGRPANQRYISPSGYEMRADFENRSDFPIASVDKSRLLQNMAEEARQAGTEFLFGEKAVDLILEERRVIGVKTMSSRYLARFVIGAEGISRHISHKASIFASNPSALHLQYAFVVAQELFAPSAGEKNIGQITILGNHISGLSRSFCTLVVPRPESASIYFSVFSGNAVLNAPLPLWEYIGLLKNQDPHLVPIVADSQVISRSSCRMTLAPTPQRVSSEGFIAAGDTVSPGGHTGIIAAIYIGQRAAQVAARCIQEGKPDPLQDYEHFFHGKILNGMRMESRILTAFADMDNEELDEVGRTLVGLNLAPFFTGEMGFMSKNGVSWVMRDFPNILRNWHLLRKIF